MTAGGSSIRSQVGEAIEADDLRAGHRLHQRPHRAVGRATVRAAFAGA